MVGKIFMDAWKRGAEHLNKHQGGGQIEVIETANMWLKFPPADLGDGPSQKRMFT